MPVLQFLRISRHRLCISAEDIQHTLLLQISAFVDVREEVEERVLRIHRVLFIDNGDARSAFAQDQKKGCDPVDSREGRPPGLSSEMPSAMPKISEEDDDTWYHLIILGQ